MQTLITSKAWRLFLSLSTLLALTFLAAGLRELHFEATQPFRLETLDASLGRPVKTLINQVADIPILQLLLFWAGIFLICVLVSFLLSPELRKLLLRAILRAFLVCLAVYFFIRNFGSVILNLFAGTNPQNLPPIDSGQLPVSKFSPPEIPSLLSFFVSLILILTIAFVLFKVVTWWRANRLGSKVDKPIDKIADFTRSSLRDLDAGRRWNDVVVECYTHMSHALNERRGLNRDDAMTPSEFAAQLKNSGMPADSIFRLTHLFEAARYGAYKSSNSEIREAHACLTEILRACGETL